MSPVRKNLKVMSLCMMTLGIAVPAAEIVFNVLGHNTATPLYIILVCIVCAACLVTGYLGIRAANTPRKALQPFVYACILCVLLGVAFTVFFCVSFTLFNPDYYVGALVACFAIAGLYYTNKLRKKLISR